MSKIFNHPDGTWLNFCIALDFFLICCIIWKSSKYTTLLHRDEFGEYDCVFPIHKSANWVSLSYLTLFKPISIWSVLVLPQSPVGFDKCWRSICKLWMCKDLQRESMWLLERGRYSFPKSCFRKPSWLDMKNEFLVKTLKENNVFWWKCLGKGNLQTQQTPNPWAQLPLEDPPWMERRQWKNWKFCKG